MKIRALFSKYLSKEMLDRLESEPASLSLAPTPARIHFILLQVRDDSLDDGLAHLSKATDIVIGYGGMCDMMCSCLLAIFGHPVSAGPDKDRIQRDMGVTGLVAGLGENVRVIYGDVDGVVGNVGSRQRLSYGPLFPNFDRYLAALVALDFGQATQI